MIYQDYTGSGQTLPGGHYRFSCITGLVTGLTAGQAFFCWRWTDAAHYLRMFKVIVAAGMNTAFGTAQISDVALFVNRNWSTSPSGSTAVTFKTNENSFDMGVAQQMGQLNAFGSVIQVATTGAVTTGTRVQDTQPLAQTALNIIALGSADTRTLLSVDAGNEYVPTIGANEGFELTVPTAQGATGKVVYYINFEFAVTNAIA